MTALKPYQLPAGITERYIGSGIDLAGTRWKVTITMTRIHTAIFGTLEWEGTEDGKAAPSSMGIEHFMGELDESDHSFYMTGFELENAKNLKLGCYSGYCNKGRLVGHWDDTEWGGNFDATLSP